VKHGQQKAIHSGYHLLRQNLPPLWLSMMKSLLISPVSAIVVLPETTRGWANERMF